MAVAIAVPSLNQGQFLGAALDSIGRSRVPFRCAVLDAGSTDQSRDVIRAHAQDLVYWRSEPDAGHAAAVNEGVSLLCSRDPAVDMVAWLNADDFYLDDGLAKLSRALTDHPDWVVVAGRAYLASEAGTLGEEIATSLFSREQFAHACTICQPATLVRRWAWERAHGVDPEFDMCLDYDLWWRLARLGPIGYIDEFVAASRDHGATKTRRLRQQYFREATTIVRRETGDVPWHWYISEALERQVDFEVGHRPGFFGSMKAAVEAGAAYLLDRRRRAPG